MSIKKYIDRARSKWKPVFTHIYKDLADDFKFIDFLCLYSVKIQTNFDYTSTSFSNGMDAVYNTFETDINFIEKQLNTLPIHIKLLRKLYRFKDKMYLKSISESKQFTNGSFEITKVTSEQLKSLLIIDTLTDECIKTIYNILVKKIEMHSEVHIEELFNIKIKYIEKLKILKVDYTIMCEYV